MIKLPRPRALVLACIYFLVFGIGGLWGAVSQFLEEREWLLGPVRLISGHNLGTFEIEYVGVSLISSTLGTLFLFTAYGLWRMKSWGRHLLIALVSLKLVEVLVFSAKEEVFDSALFILFLLVLLQWAIFDLPERGFGSEKDR